MSNGSIFDGVNEAGVGVGRIYFQPGRFKAKIVSMGKKDASESFKGVPSFFAEFCITESSNPALPVGTTVHFVQPVKQGPGQLDKQQRDLALATINELMAAVFGDPGFERETKEGYLRLAVDPSNPCKDTEIAVLATSKPMKNGGQFTQHKFMPVG